MADITREWFEERGYVLNKDFGVFSKEFGNIAIEFGYFPFNEHRVCLVIEGATIATSAASTEDIEQLERLFGEGIVDHADFMYVDDDDLCEGDEAMGGESTHPL